MSDTTHLIEYAALFRAHLQQYFLSKVVPVTLQACLPCYVTLLAWSNEALSQGPPLPAAAPLRIVGMIVRPCGEDSSASHACFFCFEAHGSPATIPP